MERGEFELKTCFQVSSCATLPNAEVTLPPKRPTFWRNFSGAEDRVRNDGVVVAELLAVHGEHVA